MKLLDCGASEREQSRPWYKRKFHCNIICSLFGERLWALPHCYEQVPAPFLNNVKSLEILWHVRRDSDSLKLFKGLIFFYLYCFNPSSSSSDTGKGSKALSYFWKNKRGQDLISATFLLSNRTMGPESLKHLQLRDVHCMKNSFH